MCIYTCEYMCTCCGWTLTWDISIYFKVHNTVLLARRASGCFQPRTETLIPPIPGNAGGWYLWKLTSAGEGYFTPSHFLFLGTAHTRCLVEAGTQRPFCETIQCETIGLVTPAPELPVGVGGFYCLSTVIHLLLLPHSASLILPQMFPFLFQKLYCDINDIQKHCTQFKSTPQ